MTHMSKMTHHKILGDTPAFTKPQGHLFSKACHDLVQFLVSIVRKGCALTWPPDVVQESHVLVWPLELPKTMQEYACAFV